MARSLGKAGVEVTILSDGANDCLARRSRFCHRYVHYELADDVKAQWLTFLQSHQASAVFACCDMGLEFIAAHRADLVAAGHRPMEASDDVLVTMLDKQLTYDLALELGIGTPRTVTAHSQDDAGRALFAGFGFPLAVKPARSDVLLRNAPDFASPKGLIVRDEAQLRAYLQGLINAGVPGLITEIIPGDDGRYCSYYTYLDEHGEPLAQFTKRKPRQFPIEFGLGTFHVSKWDPEVAEVGLALLRGMGLVGFGCVEFKRDERDGRLKVIECTPRFTMANGLVARAGVDFALLAYDRLVGDEPRPVGSFKEGVHLWFPQADVKALFAYRAKGALTTWQWLKSLAHVPHFPTFQWSDPMPFATGVRGGIRRIARNRGRSRRPRVDSPTDLTQTVVDHGGR
ncbi:MAG TPA: hypothetical protein VKU86_07755 [Acidimicrobiales bacterium]|nr:hypothetical protein [Acidimicrobiales bacterium]